MFESLCDPWQYIALEIVAGRYLLVWSQDSIVAGLAGGCEIYRVPPRTTMFVPPLPISLFLPPSSSLLTLMMIFKYFLLSAVDQWISFAPFRSFSSLPLKAWQRSVADDPSSIILLGLLHTLHAKLLGAFANLPPDFGQGHPCLSGRSNSLAYLI